MPRSSKTASRAFANSNSARRATVAGAFASQRADAQRAADRRILVQHLGERVTQAVEVAADRGVPPEIVDLVLKSTGGASEAVRVQAMHEAVQIVDGQRAGALPPNFRAAVEYHGRAQDQHQAHASAEREILDLARRLTPSGAAKIGAIYAEHGWQGVTAALSADRGDGRPFLSPLAIEVLTSTKAETGPDLAALGGRLSERIQAEEQAAQVQEVQARAAAEASAEIEAWTAKAIEEATPREGDSPAEVARKSGPDMRRLADPAFHETARQWLTQQVEGGKTRAQVLREQGLLAAGKSPGEVFLHIERSMREHGGPDDVLNAYRRPFGPRAGQDEATRALAEVVREDESAVRAHVDGAKRSHVAQGVLDRFAAQDRTVRAARERAASRSSAAPKAEARISRPAGPSVRETVEASFRQHGGAPKQRPTVGNSLQATIALAAGHRPSDVDTLGPAADRHIEAAASRMDAPEPPSLRDTIAAAIDQHAGDGDTTGATE